MKHSTRTIALMLLVLCCRRAARADTEVICTGDCNYDGAAMIDELLTGVAINLGRRTLDACPGFDLDGNGTIAIDELIGGVGNALRSCPPARFVPQACSLTLPVGDDPSRARCGELIVPEVRGTRDGRTLRLAIAVLEATGDHPAADPLVILDGGPGQGTLDGGFAAAASTMAPLRVQRDLVFFDQRGTGRSRPPLKCPEYDQVGQLGQALSLEEETDALTEELRACHDRLAAEGVNFDAYSSAAVAADVRDLTAVLGYQQYNLYGLSYGTRMALVAMRDTPERLRSVVLDSVVPVQGTGLTFYAPTDVSLGAIAAACAGDAICDAIFPDLEQSYWTLISRLADQPVILHPADPASGQPLTVVLTADRLLTISRTFFGASDAIPFAPLLISSSARGDYTTLTIALSRVLAPPPPFYAIGMAYSVLCAEQVPFDLAATGAAHAEFRHLDAVDRAANQTRCGFWGTQPLSAVETRPVASDIPTLVLIGEFDASTPPSGSRRAAETLTHSFVFEIPTLGHVVAAAIGDSDYPACVVDLIGGFLAGPTQRPDDSCIQSLPPRRFFGT